MEMNRRRRRGAQLGQNGLFSTSTSPSSSPPPPHNTSTFQQQQQQQEQQHAQDAHGDDHGDDHVVGDGDVTVDDAKGKTTLEENQANTQQMAMATMVQYYEDDDDDEDDLSLLVLESESEEYLSDHSPYAGDADHDENEHFELGVGDCQNGNGDKDDSAADPTSVPLTQSGSVLSPDETLWGLERLQAFHRETREMLLLNGEELDAMPGNSSASGSSSGDDQLTKKQRKEMYAQRVGRVMAGIDEEASFNPYKQFERDALFWWRTLRFPSNDNQRRILRRIFLVLRHGGLVFLPQYENVNYARQYPLWDALQSWSDQNTGPHTNNLRDFQKLRGDSKWLYWCETKWPIASALSHGSRILIQLPKRENSSNAKTDHDTTESEPQTEERETASGMRRDHEFWKWLVTGSPDGNLDDVISTATTGDQCQREGKTIFRRLAATHAIDYGQSSQVESIMEGHRKVLTETKVVGFTFRNTKLWGGDETFFNRHRHWGMNIPLGGDGMESILGDRIASNGEHGHLYIYYQSAADHRHGGLLIGIEGSEYGKSDQTGHEHTMMATSNKYSPTFGYKWSYKKKNKVSIQRLTEYTLGEQRLSQDSNGSSSSNPSTIPSIEETNDLGPLGAPMKKNSMVVDLSSGWKWLMDKEQEWNDRIVFETTEIPDELKVMQPRQIKRFERLASRRRRARAVNKTDI